jgi:16S rRNA (cytosine1402-N4)-methyltransferase
MNSYHQPVLLHESIEWLNIEPKGIYVDATYGGGGHSREILKRLKGGKLIAFDADADVRPLRIRPSMFVFIPENFRYLKRELNKQGFNQVNGILADLGVSSHQLDTPSRGFSFRWDAPLDMRMNRNLRMTAAQLLNTYSEQALKQVLSRYGEIEQAGRMAKVIVRARRRKPFASTSDLVNIVKPFARKGKENHMLARIFQALRIEVNQELEALRDLLRQSAEVIIRGGRLVVISYHSLEDRMVKNFMRSGHPDGEIIRDIKGHLIRPFRPLLRKPVTPGIKECRENPRASSARMRVAEKC